MNLSFFFHKEHDSERSEANALWKHYRCNRHKCHDDAPRADGSGTQPVFSFVWRCPCCHKWWPECLNIVWFWYSYRVISERLRQGTQGLLFPAEKLWLVANSQSLPISPRGINTAVMVAKNSITLSMFPTKHNARSQGRVVEEWEEDTCMC